jgi:hypothetical protein
MNLAVFRLLSALMFIVHAESVVACLPPSTMTDEISATEQQKHISFDMQLSGDEQLLESDFTLPTLPCGDSRDVTIRITNMLKEDFEASNVTTSCGCIKKLPDRLFIEKGATVDFAFLIEMPLKEETFSRYITLTSLKSGRSVRINLKCDALPHVRIVNPLAEFDSEEPRQVEFKIESAFEHVDLRHYTAQANAPEVSQFKFVALNAKQGTLSLTVEPRKSTPSTTQSACLIEFSSPNHVASCGTIALRFPKRTVVKPENIEVQKKLATQRIPLVVYSHQLQEQLAQDKVLVATIDGAADVTKIPSTVKQNETPMTLVQLELTNVHSAMIAKSKSPSINLRCGEWKTTIPCLIKE